jgi:biopolymer transport protein ExbD
MARRENSEINAGSMADIAFLLLIFFLVTTTMDVDSGISRKLSEKPPLDYKPPIIKMKNILEININRNDQLLVEDEVMEL